MKEVTKEVGVDSQPLLGDLSLEQVGKIVSFISYATSSHGISLMPSLLDLAMQNGLDVDLRVTARHRKTKLATRKRLRVLTPRGRTLFDVDLRPAEHFRAAVAAEGLGGYVASGDWWGYASRNLAIQFAYLASGFRSDQLGRGSSWNECEEVCRAYYRSIKQ